MNAEPVEFDSRMSFAAIDFETANYRSDSPCQVAVVLVEDGCFAGEFSWLIRPKDMYFSERCIAVHGIYPRDVVNEPEWDVVWRELGPLIEGRLLIAHNAMFDMAVLHATLERYEIACPRIDFQCTRLIARRCWPGRTGYGLKAMADMLGIDFKHHVAVEDARTCAEVALAAGRDARSASVESLERNLYIHRGFVEGSRRVGPKCIRRPKSAKVALRTPVQSIADRCAGLKPFDGKHFFLQGVLLGMERSAAIAFLEVLGAIVDETANEETDFWLVGGGDVGPLGKAVSRIPDPEGAMPTNESAAGKVCQVVTRIISQRQFLAMVPGGLEAIRRLVDSRSF